MATALLEPRVTELESAMAEMASAVAEASRTTAEASRTAAQTSRELAEFKNEMALFREESRAIREADRAAAIARRQAERAEAEARREAERIEAEAKREADRAATQARIEADRAEYKAERREMNRQWGALANKMGTMAEDLVAPSIPRILRTLFGCPDDRVEEIAVRVVRRSQTDPAITREFDVITACGDYFLINETKSTLAPEDVSDFVEVLASVRQFFPEQAHRQIVGVIASLYVDESLVHYAERNGLIVLSFGDEGMDLRNSDGFSPRTF